MIRMRGFDFNIMVQFTDESRSGKIIKKIHSIGDKFREIFRQKLLYSIAKIILPFPLKNYFSL